MQRSDLIPVAGLRAKLSIRYRNQHRDWFGGGASWPMTFSLGAPTQAAAMGNMAPVRAWAEQWRDWQGPGRVEYKTRNWGKLGPQVLPTEICFATPADLATFVFEGERWKTAVRRRDQGVARWPALSPVLPRHFEDLATYTEDDWQRLVTVVDWLLQNRNSGLYPRQLPIRGVDSKWLEQRMGLVRSLLGAIAGGLSGDLYESWGLRRPPAMARLVVLDPHLRQLFGGLRFLRVPADDVAALSWTPRHVLITENVQTTLSMPDVPGTVAVIGLGYHLDVIGSWRWLLAADCLYWGDIDTHGFAILARARSYQPALTSVMMDAATMDRHRDLAVEEPKGEGAPDMDALTPAERQVFRDLVDGHWGTRARLEQERIEWAYALAQLLPLLA